MPLFFLLPIALYLAGNGYVFYRSWEIVSQLPAAGRWIYSIAYLLGTFSFFLVMAERHPNLSPSWMHGLYWLSMSWLVFTLYMVLFLIVADIAGLLHLHIPYRFPICLGATLLCMGYGFYRYTRPDINTMTLSIDKSANGPKQLRVALVSDVHLGYGTNKTRLQYYISLINEQHPDLILLAGDLIDSNITPVEQENMKEELAQIKAPMGIYMVPGNHEYFAGVEKCRSFVRNETPITWMQDTTLQLANGIQLVGRDDRSNPRRKSLKQLVQSLDPQKPILLMDHQPNHLDEAVNNGIDLQVSGHTHQGQIWPLSLLTDHLFEVSHGYKQKVKTHVYVSSGLSLWGPPFRIGTRSELVILDLQFK